MSSPVQSPAPSAPPPPPAPVLSYADKGVSRRSLPMFFWAGVALILVLAYNAIFAPSFFYLHLENGHLTGNIINVLLYGSRVMLISLGMTLVIATGGIDLSVGAIMSMAGGLAAILNYNYDVVTNTPVTPAPLWIAFAAALALGLFAGVWNGILVGFVNVQPIVATLILMISGRGIALNITHGQVPRVTNETFLAFARGTIGGVPIPIILVAIMAVITLIVVRRTALGMFVEAVGNNASAAQIAGMNTRIIKLICYGFIGLCCGMAGLVDASLTGAGDTAQSGQDIELDAIVAVAIGGTSLVGGRFSLVGSLLGALVMQSLKVTIQSSSIKPEYNFVVQAAVVVGICVLQSPKFRAALQRFKKSSSPERTTS